MGQGCSDDGIGRVSAAVQRRRWLLWLATQILHQRVDKVQTLLLLLMGHVMGVADGALQRCVLLHHHVLLLLLLLLVNEVLQTVLLQHEGMQTTVVVVRGGTGGGRGGH